MVDLQVWSGSKHVETYYRLPMPVAFKKVKEMQKTSRISWSFVLLNHVTKDTVKRM